MVTAVAITGDFAAMKKFIAGVGKMKDATKLIGAAGAPRIEALINAEFGAGAGPYGDGWVAKKDGGAPFTGSSAAGWVKVTIMGGGARIRATLLPPGVFHQKGTKSGRKARRAATNATRRAGGNKAAQTEARAAVGGVQKLPARPIIPSESEGIPSTWRDAILDEARKVMATAGARPAAGAK